MAAMLKPWIYGNETPDLSRWRPFTPAIPIETREWVIEQVRALSSIHEPVDGEMFQWVKLKDVIAILEGEPK